MDSVTTETPAFEHERAEVVSPPLVIAPSTVNDATPTAAMPTQDESAEREVEGAFSPKPDVTDEIQYVAYSASVLEPDANKDSLPQNHHNQTSVQPRRSQRRKRVLEVACNKEAGDSYEKQQPKRRPPSEAEHWLGKSPIEWSVEDVALFVDSVPYCNLGSVFREHVSGLCMLLIWKNSTEVCSVGSQR